MPFAFDDGADSQVLEELVGGPAAALTAVALVVAPGARASGWGARAAAALAHGWRGPRRVLLADLDLERPTLHETAGVTNDEGVIDLIDYGISVGRLIRPAGGGAYDFLPAGIFTPDAGAVLRHDGWERVLMEVAARRGTLLAWVPSEAEGLDAVVQRAGAVLVLAESGEGRDVVERLPHPYAVLGILTPEAAPAVAAEPPATEPVAAEPAATEPSAAEPTAAEPASREAEAAAEPGEAAVEAIIVVPAAEDDEPWAAPVTESAGATEAAAIAGEPEHPGEPEQPAEPEHAAEPEHPGEPDHPGAPEHTGEPEHAGELRDIETGEPEYAGELRDIETGAVEPAASVPTAPPVGPAPGPATPGPPPAQDELAKDAAARAALARELRDRQRTARLAGAAPAPTASGSAAVERPPLAEAAGDEPRTDEATATAAPVAGDIDASRPPRGSQAQAPRAARPAPGRPGRYRRPLLWTIGVVLLMSLLAGAWHFLGGRLGRLTAPAAQSPPAPDPAPPAAPAEQNALPFVVAIEAHRELLVALNRVADLTDMEPAMLFHVEPLEREGTLFYHVMAGPVADSAAALALRDVLIMRGHKTAATPTDIRASPLAFLIGDYPTAEAADEQRDVLRRLDIPAYVLPSTAVDGAPLYRLYVGGFGSAAEADVTRQMLRSAGIRDSLVTRTGGVTAADLLGTERDSMSAGDSLPSPTGSSNP